MRTTIGLCAVLLIGLIVSAGCKKAEPTAGPPSEFEGVKVDLQKLDAEFASASPEVQERVSVLKRFYRYGQYPRAIAELDQLSTTPNLAESQKKLLNELIEQTKQVIAKAPEPRGQ